MAASTWGSLFLDERSVLDVVAAERVRLVEGRLRVVANDTLGTRFASTSRAERSCPSEAGSYLIETGQGPRGDETRAGGDRRRGGVPSDAGPCWCARAS